ncbi:MAG: outer membrane lipoprotein-sorting protein [Myxococcota bacterium]|nr:outer membrane lipoprotein-sorting protein [Myxococcota bacterium]
MARISSGLATIVAATVLFVIPNPSIAGDKVADILAKVDANLTKVEDQSYDGNIEVIKEGKTTKSLKFKVKLKGLAMKLVRFTAPGDVRGMTILTTAQGHMYIYLPSYKRVRRVAAHVRNQGFMGTDLSPEDMGTAALSTGWGGEIEREDEVAWVLNLRPKPGNETTFSKVRVTVLKKYSGVSRLEYFSAKGYIIKTQDRDAWKTFGAITLPTRFEIQDLRTGSKTVMHLLDCQVNTGIPESAFTKRAIMRQH